MRKLDAVERRLAARCLCAAVFGTFFAGLMLHLHDVSAAEAPWAVPAASVAWAVLALMPVNGDVLHPSHEGWDYIFYALGVVGFVGIPVLWNAV